MKRLYAPPTQPFTFPLSALVSIFFFAAVVDHINKVGRGGREAGREARRKVGRKEGGWRKGGRKGEGREGGRKGGSEPGRQKGRNIKPNQSQPQQCWECIKNLTPERVVHLVEPQSAKTTTCTALLIVVFVVLFALLCFALFIADSLLCWLAFLLDSLKMLI